ncbi:MAG: DUF3575 domain-containing protein [Bacteroidales bacterium]|nr:DUF3575 domain-containing protein [Bacteroidales bacterium]
MAHNQAYTKLSRQAFMMLALVLCLMLLPSGSLFLRAQERDAYRFFFPAGKARIDSTYLSNAVTLSRFRELVETSDMSNLESVIIESASSPDGGEALNSRLSVLRGETLGDFLKQNLPAILERNVTVKYVGENWSGLHRLVAGDADISDSGRMSILRILDSDETPARKKALLQRLPSWGYLQKRYYPQLRYANLYLFFGVPEPVLPELDYNLALQEEELFVNVLAPLEVNTPKVEPYVRKAEEKPLFALSTNILLDAIITPNVNLEIPLGRQWSIYTEYTFPWWTTKGNNRAWQIQKWDLGARYWFNRHREPMDVLSGHFLGLDVAGGYYDIEPNHRGWQGEAVAATLEYGYAWRASRNWRVQIYIGAGWMGTEYRYYQATSDDKHLIYQNTNRFRWLGPTKVGCSIQYLFHYRKKHRGK